MTPTPQGFRIMHTGIALRRTMILGALLLGSQLIPGCTSVRGGGSGGPTVEQRLERIESELGIRPERRQAAPPQDVEQFSRFFGEEVRRFRQQIERLEEENRRLAEENSDLRRRLRALESAEP